MPFQHPGRACAPPLDARRRTDHPPSLPGPKAEQTDRLCAQSRAWWVGDRSDWHRHEAQVGGRTVWGCLWSNMETVQRYCGCQNIKGKINSIVNMYVSSNFCLIFGEKKIGTWKINASVKRFFLNTPLIFIYVVYYSFLFFFYSLLHIILGILLIVHA